MLVKYKFRQIKTELRAALSLKTMLVKYKSDGSLGDININIDFKNNAC